jgi:hypothetical protein
MMPNDDWNSVAVSHPWLGLVLLVFGVLLLWSARRQDPGRSWDGGILVILGIGSEFGALLFGLLSATSGGRAVSLISGAHLVWIVITFLWFRMMLRRNSTVAAFAPQHHCEPKLLVSSGDRHYRQRKTRVTLWGNGWIDATLITNFDVWVSDSSIDVRAYAFGAYLWAGFWPTASASRAHYSARIACVEVKGKCRPTYLPSGSERGSDPPPTQVRIVMGWYDHGDEIGCYPYIIAGVDGDPASISPGLPTGGWVTYSIAGAKIVDDQDMGHYEWICPAEGAVFKPVIEPGQTEQPWDDPEAKLDQWLPKAK